MAKLATINAPADSKPVNVRDSVAQMLLPIKFLGAEQQHERHQCAKPAASTEKMGDVAGKMYIAQETFIHGAMPSPGQGSSAMAPNAEVRPDSKWVRLLKIAATAASSRPRL
jgi:hypothetical protein